MGRGMRGMPPAGVTAMHGAAAQGSKGSMDDMKVLP